MEVNEQAKQRIELQERLAKANGFAPPGTFFALGTKLAPSGRGTYDRSRIEFESKPPASVPFEGLFQRVAGEQRLDSPPVPVREIVMEPTGQLARRTGNGKRLLLDSERSLRSLLERSGFKEPGAAAKYLAERPAAKRASEFNDILGEAGPKRTVVLRTRLIEDAPPTLRECYGVVSEKYAAGLEVDQLSSALVHAMQRQVLPGDARGEVDYDGRRATLRAIWHSDVLSQHVGVGEIYKAGIAVKAQDDGGMGITVESLLYRAVCINLTTLECSQEHGKRRHVGETQDMIDWLWAALRDAASAVRVFAEAWDRGRQDWQVLGTPESVDLQEVTKGVYRGLLKDRVLALPGFRGEKGVDVLFQAWKREPQRSRVGIVNGITRAAHEASFTSPWAGEELEKAGGQVLTSKKPFRYVGKGDLW